jgi:hypothetical protein
MHALGEVVRIAAAFASTRLPPTRVLANAATTNPDSVTACVYHCFA